MAKPHFGASELHVKRKLCRTPPKKKVWTIIGEGRLLVRFLSSHLAVCAAATLLSVPACIRRALYHVQTVVLLPSALPRRTAPDDLPFWPVQEFEFQNDDLLDHPTFVTPYPYGDEDDDADEVHNSQTQQSVALCRARRLRPSLSLKNRSPRPLPTEARRGKTATVTNRHTNKALSITSDEVQVQRRQRPPFS